jgi:hypothetical protein
MQAVLWGSVSPDPKVQRLFFDTPLQSQLSVWCNTARGINRVFWGGTLLDDSQAYTCLVRLLNAEYRELVCWFIRLSDTLIADGVGMLLLLDPNLIPVFSSFASINHQGRKDKRGKTIVICCAGGERLRRGVGGDIGWDKMKGCVTI